MTRYDVNASLEPLRSALLRRAREDAGQEVAEAARLAEGVLGDARAHAERLLADAADAGRSDAAAVIAAETIRARRAARALELTAQREVYDELCRRVADAVTRHAAEPGQRDRLAAVVRATLGPHATVSDAPGGGVVGEVPGRRVDLSIDIVAEQAVEGLGGEVRALWAP